MTLKLQRDDVSQYNLDMLKRNPKEFLRRFVTVDETWIHQYTSETKKQSKQWVEASGSAPKRPKIQQSADKVMAIVFWNVHCIIHIDYLEKGKTLTAKYYSELLDRFDAAIEPKRPHLARKKSSFIKTMHNAPAHKAVKIWASALIIFSQT